MRWAKVFNLKQMAQTVNYLTEHNLLEYAVLEEKKKTYAEYRRSREEMRELLAAKANVNRLLNMETEHDIEREKGQEQR